MDSQGAIVGVVATTADVSNAQGYQVLEQVLPKYPSVRIVIAESAYDREGLLHGAQEMIDSLL